ncbi:RNA polymerase sigma factor [bacterium]|nr:RNA polymerase sigma factor [bacterium]
METNSRINQSIEYHLKATFPNLSEKEFSHFKSIILINEQRGRIEKFTKGNQTKVREYLVNTFRTYEKISDYVYQIQIVKDDELWEPLFIKMSKWAYAILRKNNFNPGPQTSDQAANCAAEAAIQVINAHFPYDTNFESWVYVITSNACFRFFRKGAKITNPENAVVLDQVAEILIHPNSINQENQANHHIDLLNAIEQLKEERKQVILLTYFDHLSTEDIAEKLSRSTGAVYNLRHNALKDLRKILEPNWNK